MIEDSSDSASDDPISTDDPLPTADESPSCYCRLGGVFDQLSRQYAMQVICVVGAIGPARYGDIDEAFENVSSSTLSARLEELVDAGYLSRERYAEIPPRVEYDLTPTGEELCRRLEPLLEWAESQEKSDSAESA
ncbi:winged helix-turn-helix transcriptional regulator [Natrarchaeobius sp. A-rgal3]|uniref:winged helix-turn-helix transcriptional regulator n=1 Tax=Natrarchaeobius versutus TaxID=1679078 RepID=UPI00350FA930